MCQIRKYSSSKKTSVPIREGMDEQTIAWLAGSSAIRTGEKDSDTRRLFNSIELEGKARQTVGMRWLMVSCMSGREEAHAVAKQTVGRATEHGCSAC